MEKQSNKPVQQSLSPEAQQAIGMLNLRLNDYMAQLNSVIRLLVEENSALRTEAQSLSSQLANVQAKQSECEVKTE